LKYSKNSLYAFSYLKYLLIFKMNYEEEDELLEEIDVYYNGELKDEICVMQYPLRPSDKFYGDNAELTSVQMNKEKDKAGLKLTYSIENKKNFDTQYYENKNFTQSLNGQYIDPNTNYCLGVFKNNILYLNPVSNFIQFRNDFSHMEAAEAAKKKSKDKSFNTHSSSASSRRESISLTNPTTSSTPSADSNTEPNSRNFKFYKKDTIQSYQVYEKLFFDDNLNTAKLEFVSHKEYFDFFFSNVNREIVIEKTGSERSLSYTELMEQPLPAKIEYFLKKLSLVNYYTLKKFCGSESIKDEIFLESALKYARLLKNKNLILKSEIRYDPNVKSDMCTKRNYVINLLQNSKEGIKRTDIKFLDQNETNEILSEIAQSIAGVYILKDGDHFNYGSSNPTTINANNFKHLYDKEVAFWDSINFKKNPNQSSNVVIASVNDENKLIKVENKSGGSNQMVVDEESTEERGNNISNGHGYEFPKATAKFNLDVIKSTIKSIFSSKVDCLYYDTLVSQIFSHLKLERDAPENNELFDIISELVENLCYNVNGTIFLKDVGEGDALQLRHILIEFLATRKSAKKAEIKSHLQTQGFSALDNMLNKILKTIGNYASTLWSLKEPTSG
jgi:hypothetical protein